MIDQALLDYIKKTRSSGFSDNEIKTALKQAGWTENEIRDGFATHLEYNKPNPAVIPKETTRPVFDNPAPAQPAVSAKTSFLKQRGKLLVIILIVLILLPALGLGGFYGYKRLIENQEIEQTPAEVKTLPVDTSAAEKQRQEKTTRDKKRLADISLLQSNLDKYYKIARFYPKTLEDLTSTTSASITRLPKDPESGKTYLYSPFGQPPLNYSLSFVLETGVGTLEPGIQVVSSENLLPTSTIEFQDNLIKGAMTSENNATIQITDLSKKPFYAQEEILLEIKTNGNLDIESTLLTIGNLKMMDKNKPFSFKFTAPKTPGEYEVQVFAFDQNGQGHSAQTNLTVSAGQ